MIYLINAASTATKSNTGMKTVDIAWDIFLHKNLLNVEYKRFSINPKEQEIYVTDRISLCYKGSTNFDFKMLKKDDILIYWGDFIHSEHYLTIALENITKKPRAKKDINTYIPNVFLNKKLQNFYKSNYIDLGCRLYLLDGIDNKLWNGTISFGTTLVGGNDFNLLAEKTFYNKFKKFMNSLDYIWTRDVHSALQVSHIRNDYNRSHLGIDAALIVGRDEYLRILNKCNFELPKKEYILTHFTRTKESINKMLNIADKISTKMDFELYWIPWLSRIDEDKFNNKESKYNYINEICSNEYSDLIHAVMNAKLIVTDTYHLALIAWRLKVPVVCIGSGLQYPLSSVDDKKKEIFYTMHNMLPLYFYSELLHDEEKINEYIDFVVNNLEKNYFDTIFDKIEQQSISVQKQLVNYLKEKINS